MEAGYVVHMGSSCSLPPTMGRGASVVSSAGWKKELYTRTIPRDSINMRAVPRAMATWASWPQACIWPGCREQKGRAISSVRGRASMSARSATVLPEPGLLPGSWPRFPCPPQGIRRNASLIRRPQIGAGPVLLKPSSGCWCSSLRIRTSWGNNSSVRCFIFMVSSFLQSCIRSRNHFPSHRSWGAVW